MVQGIGLLLYWQYYSLWSFAEAFAGPRWTSAMQVQHIGEMTVCTADWKADSADMQNALRLALAQFLAQKICTKNA